VVGGSELAGVVGACVLVATSGWWLGAGDVLVDVGAVRGGAPAQPTATKEKNKPSTRAS
jgi:hypothetical protein